jgi:hypothetical protein
MTICGETSESPDVAEFIRATLADEAVGYGPVAGGDRWG